MRLLGPFCSRTSASITVSHCTGRSKILQFDMTNDTSKIFMFLFNICLIALNTMHYVCQKLLWFRSIMMVCWPVWCHCHRGTTSSDDETGRSGCRVWRLWGWMWQLSQPSVIYYSLHNMGALKMMDVKSKDQCAGHEIAGRENDGPNDRTWKCRTWNSRTWNHCT